MSWGWRNSRTMQEEKKRETVEEYLKRGGVIKVCEAVKEESVTIHHCYPKGFQFAGFPPGCYYPLSVGFV